ncbi:hypothetical protein IQ241_08735 [Romeria aff. gracilis LEGE 07310]|uniref:PEP-CTERM protein-sorting domain-containing protein n=1 Tax=Vasconcelosia minhoensis LEGE 07310 TaxID=915328 RepID=A0A8J7ABF3_9CYAN|nr:hypothetical protein [Romeria gracilis]MBE9077381.1 hypothetical protein [Romeria aff. gracilis LEGE 07310]
MKHPLQLLAAVTVSGLATLMATPAQAASLNFSLSPFTGDNAKVDVWLLENGSNIDVKVDVDRSVALADLQGIFFNVANESILPSLGLVNKGAGVGESKFLANSVDTVGKNVRLVGGDSNQNPCSPTGGCDGGIEIGTKGIGKDDIQSTSWTFTRRDGQALTLKDFAGMSWGIRATSVGTGNNREGSTKLAGVVGTLLDPQEPSADVPEPAVLMALGLFAVGAGYTIKRKSEGAAVPQTI